MSDSAGPHVPLRPSIPALAWLAAAVWFGLAVAQRLVWAAYVARTGVGFEMPLAMAGLALVTVVAWRAGRMVVVLCALGLCGGLALGAVYWGHWAADAVKLQSNAGTRFVVEVLGDETVSAFGPSSICRVVGGAASGESITVQWPADARVPALGRRVEIIGAFKPLDADVRGARACRAGRVGTLRARQVRDTGWEHSVRGLVGRVRLWAVERMSAVSGTGGALLSGVVVGDRRRLSGTQADTDFRTTGLTHLVAVSGSHLVVVAAVVGWLVAAAGAGRIARSLMVAAVIGGYVVFSGVQPSAVRAWVMASAAASAWLSGRRTDGGSTLAVAATGLLVTSPTSAFDLGFQLSVAAVAGLVLFARFAETWLTAAVGTKARWVASPVALTLTATAATMPITVSTFGMLSLVSPLANVVAGPLVSAALVLGLAGLVTSWVWGRLGTAILGLAAVPAGLAADAAHLMAGWPYAAVPVGVAAAPAAAACAGAAVLVWTAWPVASPRRARAVVTVLMVLMAMTALGPPVAPGPTIELLDVGQGDAILVRDGPRAVLVDAGPSVAPMRAALARAGIRRLDAVVITHLHADHYGGLGALAGVVRVGQVLVPLGATASGPSALEDARSLVGSENVREMGAGQMLSVGGIALEALWPREPTPDASENEASIVLKASQASFSALLTGDAEGEVLEELRRGGQLGDIDVFKVGHHGSAGAVTSEQLALLRPAFALISVGAGNRFGHPTPTTVRTLVDSGSRVLRTDLCGDITVRIAPEGGYVVRLSRPEAVSASRKQLGANPRGGPAAGCATLGAIAKPSAPRAVFFTESYGQAALRVQTRLPHIRRPRPPPRARARTAQAQRGRGG